MITENPEDTTYWLEILSSRRFKWKFRQSSKPLSSTGPIWSDIMRRETEVNLYSEGVCNYKAHELWIPGHLPLTLSSTTCDTGLQRTSISWKPVILSAIHGGISTNQYWARHLAWCLLHKRFSLIFFFLSCCDNSFETGSHVVQDSLRLVRYLRMTSNVWFFCLPILRSEFKAKHALPQPFIRSWDGVQSFVHARITLSELHT